MSKTIRTGLPAFFLLAIACSSSSSGGGGGGTDAAADAPSSTDGGLAAACVAAGGTVSTGTCCMSVSDFPDLCVVGGCGCAGSSSHTVQICNCPSGCWNGSTCMAGGPDAGGSDAPEDSPSPIDSPADSPTPTDAPSDAPGDGGAIDSSSDAGPAAAACIASGGTISTQMCCTSASPFPQTCAPGACGCSPTNSQATVVCNCGSGMCWNGSTCTPGG